MHRAHDPNTIPWVTTSLTEHPADATVPKYGPWYKECSLFVAIDVVTNNTGAKSSALEGHTATAARGLLVVVAYAL
jgi:hypothetical protein